MFKTVKLRIARMTIGNALDQVAAARKAADDIRNAAVKLAQAEQDRAHLAIDTAFARAKRVEVVQIEFLKAASDVESQLLAS